MYGSFVSGICPFCRIKRDMIWSDDECDICTVCMPRDVEGRTALAVGRAPEAQRNLVSCEITLGGPLIKDFSEQIENIQTREEKYYNDEKKYVGYKFTITYNPRKWSIASSWNQGVDAAKKECEKFFQHWSASYYIITAEAHKNYMPHLHGIVYFTHTMLKSSNKFIKDLSVKFGRTEFLLLSRHSDYEKIKRFDSKIQVRDWCTYIMKDYGKYREYFVEYDSGAFKN